MKKQREQYEKQDMSDRKGKGGWKEESREK